MNLWRNFPNLYSMAKNYLPKDKIVTLIHIYRCVTWESFTTDQWKKEKMCKTGSLRFLVISELQSSTKGDRLGQTGSTILEVSYSIKLDLISRIILDVWYKKQLDNTNQTNIFVFWTTVPYLLGNTIWNHLEQRFLFSRQDFHHTN